MRRLGCSLLVVLAACGGGDKDTARPKDELTEVVVVRDSDFGTCERGLFWPSGLYSVVGYGLAPVAPPYEITHVGAVIFDSDDGWCVPDAGLRVMVWVGGQEPDKYPLGANGKPDFPDPLVEVVLGTTETDGTHGYAEVELDSPVRVEEHGTLWVVAANYRSGGTDGMGIPCLAGCVDSGDTAYQWDEDNGWIPVRTALPLFQVTVRH